MICILSPAKSLDYETPYEVPFTTEPQFLKESERVAKVMKKKSAKSLEKLMKISTALGELNHQRFQDWTPDMSQDSKPAVLAFKGDAYLGMNPYAWKAGDFEYAQNHVLLLSGLYGVLRPLDSMRPYRLEMGTKVSIGTKKNLHELWRKPVTGYLNGIFEHQIEKVLVNVASNEYFKAIDVKALDAEVITPVFKDLKNGQYKVIQYYAKRARGLMTNFIVENKIDTKEKLKLFNAEGYAFDANMSTDQEWVFTRTAPNG